MILSSVLVGGFPNESNIRQQHGKSTNKRTSYFFVQVENSLPSLVTTTEYNIPNSYHTFFVENCFSAEYNILVSLCNTVKKKIGHETDYNTHHTSITIR